MLKRAAAGLVPPAVLRAEQAALPGTGRASASLPARGGTPRPPSVRRGAALAASGSGEDGIFQPEAVAHLVQQVPPGPGDRREGQHGPGGHPLDAIAGRPVRRATSGRLRPSGCGRTVLAFASPGWLHGETMPLSLRNAANDLPEIVNPRETNSDEHHRGNLAAIHPGELSFRPGGDFTDDDSFLELGIIDSTGVLELVAFLESQYQIAIADEELVPENLDSIHNLRAVPGAQGRLA